MLSAEYNDTIKTYGCQFQSLSKTNKNRAPRDKFLYNSSNCLPAFINVNISIE